MAKKQKIHLSDKDMSNLHDKGVLEKDEITITFNPSAVSSTEDDQVEGELEELVDFDGSVLGSKVPLGYMNNKTISQRKTTDAVVPATRQGGEQGKGYFYKRYWGESVEEVGEHDMSKVLGMDADDDGVLDTDVMTAGEVKDRFKDEYDLDDFQDRMDKSGVIGKGKSRKKRIFEDEDIMKMMEVILQSKDEPKDITSTSDDLLDRKLEQLKKYMDKQGYTMDDILDKLKGNE
tara:strand:- start:1231 stop:1929 length:699 start_codon:yes stop_codon:yes gene_type:complete